jgi:hypothetical protein
MKSPLSLETAIAAVLIDKLRESALEQATTQLQRLNEMREAEARAYSMALATLAGTHNYIGPREVDEFLGEAKRIDDKRRESAAIVEAARWAHRRRSGHPSEEEKS